MSTNSAETWNSGDRMMGIPMRRAAMENQGVGILVRAVPHGFPRESNAIHPWHFNNRRYNTWFRRSNLIPGDAWTAGYLTTCSSVSLMNSEVEISLTGAG